MEEIGVPFIWTSGHKCDNSVDPKYVLVEVKSILYLYVYCIMYMTIRLGV